MHVVDSLPIARQVNVEPCTSDDWELIQLHTGLLETELLRQVCVCVCLYLPLCVNTSQYDVVDVLHPNCHWLFRCAS